MAAQGPHLGTACAVELRRLVARREASPVEVLDEFLARCARLNPAINAIVAMDAQAACAAAKRSEARVMRAETPGALEGIPITVKDNLYVAGLPATWGSRLYQGFLPPCDDIGIGRLRAAGANLAAKTNTPEFALAAHTDNLLFGPTRSSRKARRRSSWPGSSAYGPR